MIIFTASMFKEKRPTADITLENLLRKKISVRSKSELKSATFRSQVVNVELADVPYGTDAAVYDIVSVLNRNLDEFDIIQAWITSKSEVYFFGKNLFDRYRTNQLSGPEFLQQATLHRNL